MRQYQASQKHPQLDIAKLSQNCIQKRWTALIRFANDDELPPYINHIENRIRPIALGRYYWLFAGSLGGGQRASAIVSLIQLAKLNGHDPYVYLKGVLGGQGDITNRTSCAIPSLARFLKAEHPDRLRFSLDIFI